MRNEGRTGNTKKRLALAAVFIVVLLSSLTYLFVQGVKNQLWEQSVSTIIESTQQGSNTLRIQLQDDFEAMNAVKKNIEMLDSGQTDELEEILEDYAQIENGISLHLMDGRQFPADTNRDMDAEAFVLKTAKKEGVINPHISSETGVNVFHLFVKVTFQDKAEGYFLMEYEVESIVDSFSLSFYHDTGFSYVINADGEILIRSPHPNSNKTMKNLFDMLSETENKPDRLKQFRKSLEESRTGWAVFTYNEEPTVFCYTPLKLDSDWYLISIIPEHVVSAQTNKILNRSLGLIGGIIIGILLLVLFYIRYANKTNRKLNNQTDYIGHLYNAVPEGIALITAKIPHQLIQLNQEGLRLLGYPEGSANDAPKGRPLQDVIHSDDYEKIVRLFHYTTMSDEKSTFETRMQKADGGCFWADGIVEKTMDEEGRPVLIAAFHDITSEKLAAEATEREKLQERITLVRAISNAYPVIISINLTRDTLSFIYVQGGLMIGLGEQKAYSELFKDIVSTVHRDNLKEFKLRFSPESLRRTLGLEKNEVFLEAKQKLTDGKYHWISTQIIYVDNPYSEEKLAILISRRVDEQRYEEEQKHQALQTALDNARAASSAKSQFLSNMSHDIRTPMNAIVGMTAIASSHLDNPERVMECLDKISLSSKHLLSLINDVLDMSKIESGRLSMREEAFSFEELTSEVVELVKPQAAAKRLRLETQNSVPQVGKVIGDPLRIRQVYINILSNAVKYTASGGRIKVEFYQEDSSRRGYQGLVFRCSDSGAGMNREFLKKLFLPFERAHNSTTSKISGTGLGMAITKNLIDLMNGDIQVESRPGKGSVFTVTLPLKLQVMQQEEDSLEWNEVHCYPDKRILLVEDNEINREIARELISEMEVRIEEARDGEEAVKLVSDSRDNYFDLILMDIQMPKMNGYEATKAIRALDRTDVQSIPIIAMTANAFEEDVRAALRAGMNAHFPKPIDLNALERLLYQYLA